ncbi:Fic family protein [Hydrogenophaga sp. BPS33]|uniref:Fic family protein n=1 Tax=Hydrogenophaga sp. BPS33 TaxID=2651974 RepID=UPI001F1CE949|nr:Fic family protein [Hydrogenophaga sp. BPS33]
MDRLVDEVGAESLGMGIEAIAKQLGDRYSRRTLQRRLALLVAQQRIEMIGERRTARYRRRPEAAGHYKIAEPAPQPAPRQDDIPVSAEGAEIRAYVSQPRHLRKPVGYQTAFLEQYHPNHTPYLPPALRDQLHAMGRSPAAQTPAGTFAKDILNRLLIDLSWASSHLEGNTYSRLDTERLIEHGQAAEGKNALETQMILNHKQAIEYLVLAPDQARVQTDALIALHALLSDGLMADPAAVGRIRRRAVEIGGSVYLPLAFPQRLEELFGIVVQMASEITDPFEQAFFLMVHLPYLQPFEDVNKRVSRLAANIPFIRHNLCPLSFIDVPQKAYVDALLGVYELNRVALLRDVFVRAYERSCQQYVAVQQNLVLPDMFRLRHRQALALVIAAIVKQGEAATAQAVQSRMPPSVPLAEQAHFTALVLGEFSTLHAGNAVRFGIRPLEFSAWQGRHRDER